MLIRQVFKLFAIFILAVIPFSCVKEGHVVYRFEVFNITDTPITIHLSSWGNYRMYINNLYSSKYKFHEVETIDPNSSLIFSIEVGDEPDPLTIPSSITPAWEYITAIECNGVTIPKEYFANPENWELGVARQINGIFTNIRLYISPELMEELCQTNSDCI